MGCTRLGPLPSSVLIVAFLSYLPLSVSPAQAMEYSGHPLHWLG